MHYYLDEVVVRHSAESEIGHRSCCEVFVCQGGVVLVVEAFLELPVVLQLAVGEVGEVTAG